MGTVGEVTNALVSPANKLLDGIQKALGKMYEPRHLRKMADAQAYQIKKIGEAMRENSDIPIIYNNNGISLSSTDYDDLLKRAQGRLEFQELRKQENIETVAGKALNLLEGKPNVEKENADPDWLLRFFNSVEDISNEEMQDIWAMLLAGEIQRPGSFSLRTLDALRNLSPQEARTFQELSKHCLRAPIDNSFFLNDIDILNRMQIPYGSIMLLEECGLINGNAQLSFTQKIKSRTISMWNNGFVIIMSSQIDETDIVMKAYPLTHAGKELMQIIGYPMDKKETIDVAKVLCKRLEDITIEVHEIIKMVDHTNIEYEEKDLLKE